MQNDSRHICADKSFDFAARIVNLRKYPINENREFILSKQFLRCGTGANMAEAQKGQSKADFASKMNIALKEANETEYWLKLLYKTDYLNTTQFESMNRDVHDLLSILAAICGKAHTTK